MELKKFKNKKLKNYCFVNEYGSTRNGFYHQSTLLYNNNEIYKKKVNYLNRTWECYTYQTSMKACIDSLIDESIDYLKEAYKRQNNIKRITKKHQKELQKIIESSGTLNIYKLIKKEL